MQIDQRGASKRSCGTYQNILIDNMVLNDARDNRRNLACGWIDVKEAYDTLGHVWITRMMHIYRFPEKLTNVSKIIELWNVRLVVPLENSDIISEPISIKTGVLQGDVICTNLLYILSHKIPSLGS